MHGLILAAALAASGTSQPALPDILQVAKAYESGDYRACSDGLLAYDAISAQVPHNGALLAAECLSRQARFDDAFAYLRRHVPLGDVAMDDLREKDRPGLDALRKQPQWSAFLAGAQRADAERMKHMDLPLRQELLRRVAIDQRAQQAWADSKQAQSQGAALAAVNRDNLAWLRTVLITAKHWPGRTQVGSDGANALWLLIQHADADPALQRHALDLMAHAPTGEVSPPDVALLTDRVLIHEGKPQHYGTQFKFDDKDGMTMLPADTGSEAELDARRASVGLPSLADYRRELQGMYKRTPK